MDAVKCVDLLLLLFYRASLLFFYCNSECDTMNVLFNVYYVIQQKLFNQDSLLMKKLDISASSYTKTFFILLS